ncbi:MAG: RluA family pseudouridine synthase, partial [Bacteroidota bacterium]
MDVDNTMNGEKDKETFEHHRFKVDPKQTPVRIDKFLFDRLFQVSRSKIQAAIKDGAVLVDELKVKPNYKVRPGDLITISFDYAPRETQPILPENLPLDVVYEDDHLMVINKAVGMAVHPGIGNWSGTLVNALAYYLQGQDMPIKEGNEVDRPYLVHRIDKNTSGLLVVAKTDQAMSGLSKQFFDHSIERKYNAIIWGEFKDDEGTIVGNVGRDPSNRMKQFVFPQGEAGKHAVTHYRVLERMYYISLIECQLETGRTHQIRVHMKYKGHP